jgi:hypothetical protein
MTRKLWTIGAALGELGLALVAVIFFYFVPALANASLQPAPKVKWDHPLHWLGKDDILFQATQIEPKIEVQSNERWPGIPLEWWGADATQTSAMPITTIKKPGSPVSFPGRYGAVAEGYWFRDSPKGDGVWVRLIPV